MEATNFYQNASGNFGANMTEFGASGLYGAASANPQNDYRSRVRSTQANGAGPNADPAQSPWSFTDFAFGRKSVLISSVQGKRRVSVVGWIVVALVGWLIWRKFIK